MYVCLSSLSCMPSGRFRPPMIPCFSMLSFFFKFAVFLAHHPVQTFFSWSSPSSFTLHSSFYYFSLKCSSPISVYVASSSVVSFLLSLTRIFLLLPVLTPHLICALSN